MINGVGPEYFQESGTNDFAERLRKRVLFVGGWIDIKGRRMLPLIWKKVNEQHDDAKLTILGTV